MIFQVIKNRKQWLSGLFPIKWTMMAISSKDQQLNMAWSCNNRISDFEHPNPPSPVIGEVLTREHGNGLHGAWPSLSPSEQQPHRVAEAMEGGVVQQRVTGVHELDQDGSRFSRDLHRIRRDILLQVWAIQTRHNQTFIVYGRLERRRALKKKDVTKQRG